MKTSTFILLCSSLASVIIAAEPAKPSQMHLIDRGSPKTRQMHLIDRTRTQTNTPPAYRVSVAYDLTRPEPVSYSEYVPSRR
jgi:hypothetical protein